MLVNASHMLVAVAVALLSACALHSAEEVCSGSSCAEDASMSEFSLMQLVIHHENQRGSKVTAAEEQNLPKEMDLPADAMKKAEEAVKALDMSTDTSAAWDKALAEAIEQFEQAHPGEFDDEFVNALSSTGRGETAGRLSRPPTLAENQAIVSIMVVALQKVVNPQGKQDVKALIDNMLGIGFKDYMVKTDHTPGGVMPSIGDFQVSLLQVQLFLQTPATKHRSEVTAAEADFRKELDLPVQNANKLGEASDMPKETSGSWDKSLSEAIMHFEQVHPGEFDEEFFKGLRNTVQGAQPSFMRLPTGAEMKAMVSIIVLAHQKMAESQGNHNAKEIINKIMNFEGGSEILRDANATV